MTAIDMIYREGRIVSRSLLFMERRWGRLRLLQSFLPPYRAVLVYPSGRRDLVG
jgi:hypothetical protein